MKLTVDYPAKSEEREILDRMARTDGAVSVPNVVPLGDLVEARRVVDEIYMDDKIKAYIVDLIVATRKPEDYKLDLRQLIEYGASPRATIWLALASKAHAFLQGRGYVTPQDVKDVAPDVLRHRVIVSYEAEAEDKTSDDIVKTILDHVLVP
jgi:MoxR-like ATPase